MNCALVRQRLAAFINEQLPSGHAAGLQEHLLECSACYEEYEYEARLNSPLRELGTVEPPAALAMAIRVRLSHESQKVSFWERWQMRLSDLMRPVALPAAGGLLSALILFGILVPAVWVTQAAGFTNDVPTVLSTAPRLKQPSLLPVYEDMLVEAWIDEQGKISNFNVLDQPRTEYRSSDVLLTTIFEPATRFGQPTSSKVLVSLRRITIKG